MKFIVKEHPTRIIMVKPKVDSICSFKNKYSCLAWDIVDFINDKYWDKEINKEWPKISLEEQLKYHESQVEILKEAIKTGKSLRWNEHGNGVE